MDDLERSIRDQISEDLATPTHAGIIAGRISRMIQREADGLPHPVSAIVEMDGLRYLVAQISYINCGSEPATYTLRGHPTFGTSPELNAWKTHDELELVAAPNAFSWRLLRDAVRIDQESRIAKAD